MKLNDKQTTLEEAIHSFALSFEERFFGELSEDSYWVGDEIGGVYVINDYYFDFNDMREFVKYNYTTDKMFEYCSYTLDQAMKNERRICIRDYKKLKHGTKR